MGAYLDEYGTVIVEAITGVIVLALMYLALAAAGGALETDFFNEGSYGRKLESHISMQTGPELRAYREISIPLGEAFSVEELIISAFDGRSYELHYLTADEASSLSEIKSNLKSGCVNVVGADGIEDRAGSYKIILFAKAETGFEAWTRADCRITIYDPEEE